MRVQDAPYGAQMWPAQAKSTSLLCQNTTIKNLLAISNHETNVSLFLWQNCGICPINHDPGLDGGNPKGMPRPEWVKNHLGG